MTARNQAVWEIYRAECRPFDTGCRQCGRTITRGRAYCSAACSHVFQVNHFWSTARDEAILTSSGLDGDTIRALGMEAAAVCARCKGPARAIAQPETVENGRRYTARYWAPEVNHKTPLNGVRPFFGCCHHQDNLECVLAS